VLKTQICVTRPQCVKKTCNYWSPYALVSTEAVRCSRYGNRQCPVTEGYKHLEKYYTSSTFYLTFLHKTCPQNVHKCYNRAIRFLWLLFCNQVPHLHIFYSIFQAQHGKDYVPKAKEFYKDILTRI